MREGKREAKAVALCTSLTSKVNCVLILHSLRITVDHSAQWLSGSVTACRALLWSMRAGVLTGAGHGRRVSFRAEVSLVAGAGSGALPDGVTVEWTLGTRAVGGQSSVVTNLTG